jgi:hypothetical protein
MLRATPWIVLIGSLIFACGDDNDVTPTSTPGTASTSTPTVTATNTPTALATSTPTPTTTSTPTNDPEESLYPLGFRSDVGAIDVVLGALESGDGSRLAALIELQELPCTSPAQGGNTGYPECDAGEPAGTPVAVFLVSNCQPDFAREAEAPEIAARFGEGNIYRLHAAFEPGANGRAAYGLIVSTGEAEGWRTAYVSADGGLLGMSANCGGEYIPPPEAASLVVPPPQ